jgi:hypothetical protein
MRSFALFRSQREHKSRVRTWILRGRYHVAVIDADYFLLSDTVDRAKPVQNRV